MSEHSSKAVLITGASSGIGQAIAEYLSGQGHRLMLVARRADRLEKLAAELPGEAAWHQVDITDRGQMQAAATEAISRYGGVDVLVNNAGIMPLSVLAKGLVDDWDRMIDVNIKGVLYGINAVLGHMLERGSGHVVNISSLAGMRVAPAGAVYSGTKFAVRAIGDGLRQETAGVVRVTTILPGAYLTELAGSITDTETLEAMRKRFGGFRLGDAARIAEAVGFAINQPEANTVREMVVAPSAQPF